MFSENEKVLIGKISPHWLDVIQKIDITPIKLYQILCVECFMSNKQGPEIEALRRAMIALESCKVYRLTPEFEELCKF